MVWCLMDMLMFTITVTTTGLWTVARECMMTPPSPVPAASISLVSILWERAAKQPSSRSVIMVIKMSDIQHN